MAQQLALNNGLKVLTPNGFKTFAGITKTWHEEVVIIKTESLEIVAGVKHKFLVDEGWVQAEKLAVGMNLTREDLQDETITDITIKNEPQWMYDLLDVDGGNAYFVNGVICHNCQFLSSDALLIDSLKLSTLRASLPLTENMGFRFWSDKIGGRNKTYLVGVDPATGNGSDFTVIQVVEFPKMEQIAELRLNSVNVPLVYSKLKWLLKFLRQPDETRGRAEVVWSFERNGVGEALVAMIQNDDAADGGTYIDGVDLFCDNLTRLGVFTTPKAKLVSCMQLKQLVERGDAGIKIHSDILLFELQNFIAAGGTYKAKNGSTDDAVMAMSIIMRLLNRLSTYDDKARKIVYESVAPDSDRQEEQGENHDQFGDEHVPFVMM